MGTDLFSKQSHLYSQFRPQYPKEIYDFLTKHCGGRELAWDCATGNGQAASDLSRYFKKVIATDSSEKQIQNALPLENVEYQVLKAEEKLSLPNASIDLITVAQALHWFDLEVFYSEARRLLKPDGVFATWAYSFHSPIQPDIDSHLNEFYFQTLGPFWKPNNRLIWEGYRDLPFPFEEITTPKLSLSVSWSLEDLRGYFKTWSSTQLYIDKQETDPTGELLKNLLPLWGDPKSKRNLSWNLIFKAGKL